MAVAPPVARPTEPQAAVALGLAIASFLLCPVVLAVAALVVAKQASTRIERGGHGGRELVQAAAIVAKLNLAIAGAIVLVVLAVAAFRGDDGEGARLGEADGTLDVLAIREGDCFDDPEGSAIIEVQAVPCEGPHDNEVYLVEDRPEAGVAAYPGEAVLQAETDELCLDAFAPFVGVPKAESELSFLSLYPTTDSWQAGDRAVVCAIYDPAGPVTGTLQGG